MPLFYEDAAHLLLFLMRAGLVIKPGVDCRLVLQRLAELLRAANRDARGLSHYGAATWFLDDLTSAKFVTFDRKSRQKILAILGTGIGNIETGRSRPARR